MSTNATATCPVASVASFINLYAVARDASADPTDRWLNGSERCYELGTSFLPPGAINNRVHSSLLRIPFLDAPSAVISWLHSIRGYTPIVKTTIDVRVALITRKSNYEGLMIIPKRLYIAMAESGFSRPSASHVHLGTLLVECPTA